MGAADFIDARLAVLLAYLALASLQGPERRPGGRRVRRRGWRSVCAGAGRRGGAALGRNMSGRRPSSARRSAPSRRAPRALVVAPPTERLPAPTPQDFYRGLTNFVVIDRRALVSTLFTGKGMQPVAQLDPRMADDALDAGPSDWLAATKAPAAARAGASSTTR